VDGIQLGIALKKHNREHPAVGKSPGADRLDRPRNDNFSDRRLPERTIFDSRQATDLFKMDFRD
jgi:hypothetical protein